MPTRSITMMISTSVAPKEKGRGFRPALQLETVRYRPVWLDTVRNVRRRADANHGTAATRWSTAIRFDSRHLYPFGAARAIVGAEDLNESGAADLGADFACELGAGRRRLVARRVRCDTRRYCALV